MFKVQVNDAFYNQLEFLLYLNCWTSVSCLAGMKVFTQQHVAVVKGPASVLWSNNYITAECYLTCHKAHSCRLDHGPRAYYNDIFLSLTVFDGTEAKLGFLSNLGFISVLLDTLAPENIIYENIIQQVILR